MTSRFSSTAVPSTVLLACLALVGCGGGGGGGGGSSSPSATASISGKVIDGYIEGATVCLDTNANQACDPGEPSRTTAKDGSYELDTSAVPTSQIRAAHLLTVVPITAKDDDDDGKTLEAAGKKGFTFMAPVAAYETGNGSAAIKDAVISPFTTLISHDMIANSSVLATARTNVGARLGVADSTKLTKDFVAAKDTDLMPTAQMLTVAIGEVKAQARTSNATERQAFFAALEYLQKQVPDLKKAFDSAKKQANASAKPVDWVKKAFEVDAAKPLVSDLLAEAKKITESSAAASVVALIEQGLYNAEYVLEPWQTTSPASFYWKISGSGGKITDEQYTLTNNKWVKDQGNSPYDWNLTATGWKLNGVCAPGESATYSAANDGVTSVKSCGGETTRLTARTVDASNKTLGALGLTPPQSYANTVMPDGSQLIWFKDVSATDEYRLYTGFEIKKGNATHANLDSFITANTQANASANNRSFVMDWSGLHFSFATNGDLTLFKSFNDMTPIGTATYTRRMVHGVEVLIINAQAPEQDLGERIMFAVKDGQVYGGSHTPVGTHNSLTPMFNKTMMNAILNAGKAPSVLN